MTAMKQLSIFIFLTAVLTGCGLFDDKYERPVTAAPAAFAEGQGAVDDKIASEWWTTFNSAPLNNLMAQAQANNLDLAAAVARIQQADAQARIAGAPLLPSLDLTGDGTRAKSSGGRSTSVGGFSTGSPTTTTGSTFTSSAGKPNNSFSGRLNASYELDFWGRNSSAMQSAEALRDASRFDRETVGLTIAGDVANTYFSIVGLENRIALAKQNLTSAEGLLDAINKRASVGLVSGLGQAQQENLVAVQRTVLPGLNLQLRQNIDALAILLGQLPESVTIETPDAGIKAIATPVVAPGLPSTLLARRPDVANAEAQLIAATADINQARAAFFPSISLTGSYGYASNQLSNLIRADNTLWSIGAGVTQTIFDNGALFGQLDLNKARKEELVTTYRKTVLSAFADTENALAAVRETAAQEAGQREAMRSAQTAFDLSQRQFQAGITDITTTLDTQRALFSAQDTFIQARLAHLQTIVSLYQALGGGWTGRAPQSP